MSSCCTISFYAKFCPANWKELTTSLPYRAVRLLKSARLELEDATDAVSAPEPDVVDLALAPAPPALELGTAEDVAAEEEAAGEEEEEDQVRSDVEGSVQTELEDEGFH